MLLWGRSSGCPPDSGQHGDEDNVSDQCEEERFSIVRHGLAPKLRHSAQRHSRYFFDLWDICDRLKAGTSIPAVVTAAVHLSDDIIERIQAALKEVVQKEVVVTVNQDPSIIGGIIAQVGDLTLDGSLRTQLKSLTESLRRGEGV